MNSTISELLDTIFPPEVFGEQCFLGWQLTFNNVGSLVKL